eukprot:gnl/Dysnectes_brevis/7800_a13437_272.p1 GENE.gnl/Dysnectes_brevis/7800_a13437_272~~gnl/Dysnectes_brevis/7800_a13437_272.p1  ORF type:complete len:287 (+),score=30.99 gnl/Dysnectes_brevis/7800_a13437_272:43-903(+)
MDSFLTHLKDIPIVPLQGFDAVRSQEIPTQVNPTLSRNSPLLQLLEKQKRLITALTTDLDTVKAEKRDLEAKYKRLHAQARHVQLSTQTKVRDLKQVYQQELTRWKTDLNETQSQLTTLRAEHASLLSESHQTTVRIPQLEEELKTTREQLTQAQSRTQRAEESVRSFAQLQQRFLGPPSRKNRRKVGSKRRRLRGSKKVVKRTRPTAQSRSVLRTLRHEQDTLRARYDQLSTLAQSNPDAFNSGLAAELGHLMDAMQSKKKAVGTLRELHESVVSSPLLTPRKRR